MPGRIRTFDRPIKSRMLYQLSYGHVRCGERLCNGFFRPVNTPNRKAHSFVGKLGLRSSKMRMKHKRKMATEETWLQIFWHETIARKNMIGLVPFALYD